MKTIIAGSRTINDEVILKYLIPTLDWEVTEVVSGNAKGADTLGEVWAYWHKVPIKYFRANWDRYGRGAGFIRNEAMAEYGEALILLWDGISKGSKHMLGLARDCNLKIHVELVPSREEYRRELVRGMEE